MSKERTHCSQPDRDEASIECGYPLPCPHHTLVAELADLEDVLERAPVLGNKLSETN